MTITGVARQTVAQLMLVSPPRRRERGAAGFYEPPDPLPDGKPGDVIRSERVDAYLVPGLRLRARAWRVLYRSTAATGEPTAVSGIILLPRGHSRNPRPLIGYAIGTHGIGDAAAPSRLLPRGRLAVIPNGPHAVNYTTPQALAELVRAFITGSGP